MLESMFLFQIWQANWIRLINSSFKIQHVDASTHKKNSVVVDGEGGKMNYWKAGAIWESQTFGQMQTSPEPGLIF